MSELTSRERFQAVMHFEPGVRTLDWEFAYWVGAVERWYGEGLKRTSFAHPPGLPAGSMAYAEALPGPNPSILRFRDVDIHRRLSLDEGTIRVPLMWRFCPQRHEVVLEEDETSIVIVSGEGIKMRHRKDRDSVPHYLAGPVHDRASWEQVKADHFGLAPADILARFPANWPAVAPTYRDHDYPLGLVLDGFFSTPRELLGVEPHLMMYHDDPALLHNINARLCDLWLAMLEEVVANVDLDFVYFWEDMAYKNGPLISPKMFDEFVAPYYRRLTGFLRAHGVDVICVDTDGDCRRLIPGFLQAGVSGLYPFEVQAGMDIVEVRKNFPRLLIQGGIDKTKIALGGAAIDAELEAKLPSLLSQGGFIPCCDHLVPPDVSWENFVYYRERVKDYIAKYPSRPAKP
jgi:uroporphyrinogen decarboxylase